MQKRQLYSHFAISCTSSLISQMLFFSSFALIIFAQILFTLKDVPLKGTVKQII